MSGVDYLASSLPRLLQHSIEEGQGERIELEEPVQCTTEAGVYRHFVLVCGVLCWAWRMCTDLIPAAIVDMSLHCVDCSDSIH